MNRRQTSRCARGRRQRRTPSAAAICFRSRRAFLRCSHDRVRRSVVALIDDSRPNSASSAPNTHSVRSNAPAASSNAPRPSIFRIARVWPPLDSASRAARATSFGPSAIASVSSAPRAPAFSPTRPTSLASRTSAAGLLGMKRRLDRADGLPRPQHRSRMRPHSPASAHRRYRARSGRPIQRQPLAEPPDLAGVLDQRQTGAHRRHAADRNIGRRRHRKPRRRQSQHQPIGVLAHRQMLAFAHHVPDVAEHEEIAGHRAGHARDIVGISGDEPAGKAAWQNATSNSLP